MEILLDRRWKKDDYTIGVLSVNGKYLCETLEPTDRGMKDNMSLTELKFRKVTNRTAIPTGRYQIRLTYSPKFGNTVWGRRYGNKCIQLMDVKCFMGVRIHPGNKVEDTSGCVLLGRNLEKGKVLHSTEYYYKLMDSYIVPALQKGESIYITIK